jgi:hypothetical protein
MRAVIKHALDARYIGYDVGDAQQMPKDEARKFLSDRFVERNTIYRCTINGKEAWKRKRDLRFL